MQIDGTRREKPYTMALEESAGRFSSGAAICKMNWIYENILLRVGTASEGHAMPGARAGWRLYMENNFRKWITGLQHIGVPTDDMEKTIDFYKALGFQTVLRTVNLEAGEEVTFLRLGDVTIESYENKQAAMVPGALDHIALNVTDIEEVFRMAKEKGFPMLDTKIRFLPFWENGVKFFTVLGPNKEKVEFSQYL